MHRRDRRWAPAQHRRPRRQRRGHCGPRGACRERGWSGGRPDAAARCGVPRGRRQQATWKVRLQPAAAPVALAACLHPWERLQGPQMQRGLRARVRQRQTAGRTWGGKAARDGPERTGRGTGRGDVSWRIANIRVKGCPVFAARRRGAAACVGIKRGRDRLKRWRDRLAEGIAPLRRVRWATWQPAHPGSRRPMRAANFQPARPEGSRARPLRLSTAMDVPSTAVADHL